MSTSTILLLVFLGIITVVVQAVIYSTDRKQGMEIEECFNLDEGHQLVTAFNKDSEFFIPDYDIIIVNLIALAATESKKERRIIVVDLTTLLAARESAGVEGVHMALEHLRSGQVEAFALINSGITYEDVLGVSIKGIDVIQWENRDIDNITATIRKKFCH